MRELSLDVPPKKSGRLDIILTELLAKEDRAISRSQVSKWIAQGRVIINGTPAHKAGMAVEEGDEILCMCEEQSALSFQPYHQAIPLLFEDEHLAVIDKPPRLTVHDGAGTGEATLVNALITQGIISPAAFPGNPRPGIVHRLDKDTSGVMVVAKSGAVLSALSEQFSERKTTKEYLALALRKPRGGTCFDKEDQGVLSQPIGRHPTARNKMGVSAVGRSAITEWQVIERLARAFFLHLVIRTGRTHQIRVHLESAGSGVIGDALYGDFSTLPRELVGAVERVGRQALHASSLGFTHPVSRKLLEFTCPLPEDLSGLVQVFRDSSS